MPTKEENVDTFLKSIENLSKREQFLMAKAWHNGFDIGLTFSIKNRRIEGIRKAYTERMQNRILHPKRNYRDNV